MKFKSFVIAASIALLSTVLWSFAPATASSPSLSSRDVFAQVFAQSDASRNSVNEFANMSHLEDVIAAAHPKFFDEFGQDIASGRPDRVKSALESGYALLHSLTHGGRVASDAASVANVDALERIGIGVVQEDGEEIDPLLMVTVASSSAFLRERFVADIAHRYVGRVARK